jgi:uncharacterized damage-inducible protein DinB
MPQKSFDLHHYLIYMLDEAALQKAWHGTNFLGSIRNVSAAEALKRPGKDRHNIWELTVHSAYWKYRIAQRIKRDKQLSFPFRGTDWFRSPVQLSNAEWSDIRKLAKNMHDKLKVTIQNIKESRLKVKNGKHNVWELIVAIALHDVYHTGQIQLVKKLIRK